MKSAKVASRVGRLLQMGAKWLIRLRAATTCLACLACAGQAERISAITRPARLSESAEQWEIIKLFTHGQAVVDLLGPQ